MDRGSPPGRPLANRRTGRAAARGIWLARVSPTAAGRHTTHRRPRGWASSGLFGLDYVNTRTGPPGGPLEDVLGDFGGLVAWAGYVGIADEAVARRLASAAADDPGAARRVFRRARDLGEDLDRLFRSVAAGDPPPASARSALRDAAADALSRAELVPGATGYDWSWAGDLTLAGPLGPVVQAAVDLMTSGPLDRLKACPGCGFLFLDESKNRSRRWCSMEDCGAAEKMRRYVRRRAARRG